MTETETEWQERPTWEELELHDGFPAEGRFGVLVPTVEYRGKWYSEKLAGTFTRSDGLKVTIEGHMDSELGPVCRDISITTDEPLRSALHLPLPSMLRLMVKGGPVFESPSPGVLTPVAAPEDKISIRQVGRKKVTDERLERVAAVYRKALKGEALDEEGVPMTVAKAVAEEIHVSESRAKDLILESRKAGFLPPTTRGKPRG